MSRVTTNGATPLRRGMFVSVKKTYVLCLNQVEFTRFLNRILEINNDMNRALDHPYVYCYAPHCVTQLENFDVILFGRYWKGKMYGTEYYNKHLKTKARVVENPGPEKGRGVRIVNRHQELMQLAREKGWTL